MRARAVMAACVLIGGLGLSRADDKPLDRAELDRRVAKVAHDSAVAGTGLFNGKNYEGCFGLYQGSLMAIHPLLDHRPKLAEFVKERLDKAKAMPADKGAFVLREALDVVQKETAESFAVKKPLWERAGGEKVIRAVVHDFLAAALKDPKVNLTRGGKIKLEGKDGEAVEQALVELFSWAGGGTLKYNGPTVKDALAGTRFTDDEFKAMLGHLAAAMEKNKVGVDERTEIIELLGAVKAQIIGQ